MKKLTKGLALCSTAVVAAFGFSGAAAAQGQMLQATMQAENNSGASGTAWIDMQDGNTATFRVTMNNVVPEAPHAQHVHFGGEAAPNPTCPDPSVADDFAIGSENQPNTQRHQALEGNEAQVNFDEIIASPEARPSYGPVQISLTTEGDTSADSGLAVNRFPVADASGTYTYERDIQLTDEQAQQVREGNVVVVSHGVNNIVPEGTNETFGPYNYSAPEVDVDGNGFSPSQDDAPGEGDGPYPISPLAAQLGMEVPLEATAPAACGAFTAAPTGGVETGLGSGAETSNQMFAMGGASLAIAGAGAGLMYHRRRAEA